MASGGSVKRRRVIRSYAGFATGAAKYTIIPMTEAAHKYASEFLARRVGTHTGTLSNSLTWDVRGLTGAVKVTYGIGGAPHAHLIEYGTGPRSNAAGAYRGEGPALPFMRPGARKALREYRKFWKSGVEEAKREQGA